MKDSTHLHSMSETNMLCSRLYGISIGAYTIDATGITLYFHFTWLEFSCIGRFAIQSILMQRRKVVQLRIDASVCYMTVYYV